MEKSNSTVSVVETAQFEDGSLPECFERRLRDLGRFSDEEIGIISEELNCALAGFEMSLELDAPHHEIGGYSIVREIGHGGAGTVYIGENQQGEQVAIKVVRHSKNAARFEREMDFVQRLAHPNIVVAYDAGISEDKAYISMELLAGPDLQKYVDQQGPVGWKESLGIIRQAAMGLHHAHERGLVHRDIKPGNLLWDEDKTIKVADLGLAAVVADEPDSKGGFQTIEHFLAGTPLFMAPEQAKCLASADVRSDIFSLGATWFFLLTGKYRIQRNSILEQLAELHSDEPLTPLPEDVAPEAIRQIFERMTARSPEDRFKTMQEVIDAIDGLDEIAGALSMLEVLVVEDNADDMLLAIEMLSDINDSIRTRKASTLNQAIAEINRGQQISIALLDLALPDSEGVSTVHQIREHAPKMPLVVMTGTDDVKIGQQCIEAGADEFVCKQDLDAHRLERILYITQSRAERRNSL